MRRERRTLLLICFILVGITFCTITGMNTEYGVLTEDLLG